MDPLELVQGRIRELDGAREELWARLNQVLGALDELRLVEGLLEGEFTPDPGQTRRSAPTPDPGRGD